MLPRDPSHLVQGQEQLGEVEGGWECGNKERMLPGEGSPV